MLRIHHDEGGSVTSNLTRIQDLIELRSELLGAHDALDGGTDVEVVEVRTAEVAWLQAFEPRGRDPRGCASCWADVPTDLEGVAWGEPPPRREARAFQETLILPLVLTAERGMPSSCCGHPQDFGRE